MRLLKLLTVGTLGYVLYQLYNGMRQETAQRQAGGYGEGYGGEGYGGEGYGGEDYGGGYGEGEREGDYSGSYGEYFDEESRGESRGEFRGAGASYSGQSYRQDDREHPDDLTRALNEDAGRMQNITGTGRGTSMCSEDTSGTSIPHVVGRGVTH